MKFIITLFALSIITYSCSKDSQSDCWKCRMTFPIGGPDKDTVICQETKPNFTPRDANGNDGGLNCVK